MRTLGSPGCGTLTGSAPRVCFVNGAVDPSVLGRLLRVYRSGSVYIGIVSGDNAAARPTVTFHMFERLICGGCSTRRTTGHVFYAASGTGNALGDLTSRRNCRDFIIPSRINNECSILATINLLPVTYTNVSVSTLVGNTRLTRGDFGDRSVTRGSILGCTIVEGYFCGVNGHLRYFVYCRPYVAVFGR